MRCCLRASALIFLTFSAICVHAAEPDHKPVINPAPTANDWAELAKLPDWSGIWVPKINDQHLQLTTNPPPWTAKAAAQITRMFSELKAGRPRCSSIACPRACRPGC